jgi:hypothetical protein
MYYMVPNIYLYIYYISILSLGSIYIIPMQTPSELGGPIHRADVAPVWAHEQRWCPAQNPRRETTTPGRTYPLEIVRDHTCPQSRPHHHNPTRRWFLGFAEAILHRRRHLNPSNSNYLDRIHPRLRVSHLHYDVAKDPPSGDECIHDSGTGFPLLPPWM